MKSANVFFFLKCMKYYLVPFDILSIFSLIGLRMGLTARSSTIKHFFDQAAENYIVNFIAKNQEKTSPEVKEAN